MQRSSQSSHSTAWVWRRWSPAAPRQQASAPASATPPPHRGSDPRTARRWQKTRCIPAKHDQAGYETGIGIARDVVVTLDVISAAQDRRVRPPAIPKELDDGDHNRQTDPWNGSQHGHTDEADNRQPEFPARRRLRNCASDPTGRRMRERAETVQKVGCHGINRSG